MGPPMPAEYQWLVALRPFRASIEREAEQDTDPNVVADYALEKLKNSPMEAAVYACALREDFAPTLRGSG